MPKIKLSDNTVNIIKDICIEFENKESELINVLHKVQGKLGYLAC
jgi:NADP-reducing hydrogenase subunit HndA